jgi:hypothetical protein
MTVTLVKKFGVGLLVMGMLTVFSGLLGVGNAGAAQNPGGNNGTVKIDGDGLDEGADNNPHVGCQLVVEWFGFDAGTRTTTATFTAHAPTGSGETLLADTFTFTGTGDSSVLAAERTYDLSDALAGYTPSSQGFHVKLTVDVVDSGSKAKVLWVNECDGTEDDDSDSSSSSDSESSSSDSESSSSESSSSESSSSDSESSSSESSSSDSESSSSESSSSDSESSSVDNTSSSTTSTGSSDSTSSSSTLALADESATPADSTGAAVLGLESNRSGSLPRTGIDPTALLGIGSALTLGGSALVASTTRMRRRSN